MKRVYIAGAMAGLKGMGYQKFFNKAEELTETKGWDCVNPAAYPYEGVTAELQDDGKVIVEVDKENLDDFTYHKVLFRDFQLIDGCDAIYMMSGWQKSKGASCELAYAKQLGKELIYEVKGDGNKARTYPYKTR